MTPQSLFPKLLPSHSCLQYNTTYLSYSLSLSLSPSPSLSLSLSPSFPILRNSWRSTPVTLYGNRWRRQKRWWDIHEPVINFCQQDYHFMHKLKNGCMDTTDYQNDSLLIHLSDWLPNYNDFSYTLSIFIMSLTKACIMVSGVTAPCPTCRKGVAFGRASWLVCIYALCIR